MARCKYGKITRGARKGRCRKRPLKRKKAKKRRCKYGKITRGPRKGRCRPPPKKAKATRRKRAAAATKGGQWAYGFTCATHAPGRATAYCQGVHSRADAEREARSVTRELGPRCASAVGVGPTCKDAKLAVRRKLAPVGKRLRAQRARARRGRP